MVGLGVRGGWVGGRGWVGGVGGRGLGVIGVGEETQSIVSHWGTMLVIRQKSQGRIMCQGQESLFHEGRCNHLVNSVGWVVMEKLICDYFPPFQT